MEAELRHATTSSVPAGLAPRQSVGIGWRDVVFSVRAAQRALPYIAGIAADAAEAYRIVQVSREALGTVAVIADRRRRLDLCEQRDRALTRLNSAIDDCNAVGAHIVDISSGRVSLPASIDDAPVCLLWRLGDDVGSAWADLVESSGRG